PPDTKVIFVATFSCLCLFLLFVAVFFIYRCTRHGKLAASVSGISARRARLFSSKPEESRGVTYVQLNTNALSEAASVPTEEPPGSCDYATLKV
ncbi:V-set and transmembrane domain-containing protein 1, partial [Physeter macrocephalus]|uniref:V-set and transmembrane domain-containing protein 1 n=1 Tax=Physeter macrocephalus TaxID=9755 RepID=A0A9W2W7T6_PHYMC